MHDDLECAELDLGDDSTSRNEHIGSNAKFWESLLKERHQQLLKEEEQQVREQWRSHHLHSADVSPALDAAGMSPSPRLCLVASLEFRGAKTNPFLPHPCIMPCLISCIACLSMEPAHHLHMLHATPSHWSVSWCGADARTRAVGSSRMEESWQQILSDIAV